MALAPEDRAARSPAPGDIEDMYYDPPLDRGFPAASTEDAIQQPLGSPIAADRQLGLYDDPDDLDQLQQELELRDEVDEAQGVISRARSDARTLATSPGPRDAIAPDGLASWPLGRGSPDADSDDSESYALFPPGVSRRTHPLLAHVCYLPELPKTAAHRATYDNSHPLWFVRIILLLVAFLHTHHHVTFRAADLVLFTLRAVFVTLRLVEADDPMPQTLTTTLRRLNLTDSFYILIECPACRRLYKPDINNVRAQCYLCETPLFTDPSRMLLLRLCNRPPPTPIPKTVSPLRLLSAVLAYLMGQPGMEAHWDAWKTRTVPPAGEYRSIQDGRRWKTLQGPDGRPFFDPRRPELLIAVIFHVDWFSVASSPFAASYSTGALSFSLPTLPPALRYRAENLILTALTAGPKEPDAEELQHWMSLIVDDLQMLYYLGIVAPTPSAPQEGRRAHAAVICTCTDHPAMCKVSGTADKSHSNVPCTAGTVKAKDMFSDEWCPPRSYEDHLRLAREWKALETKKERDAHFKQHGARWAEMMRLPYYDCMKMTVIDPMHNLLLGVVKTQWYACWIKPGVLRADTKAGTKRELSMMHRFLETFEVAPWVGRLPLRVGEPAGGSLTADEYRHLIVGPGCIILPIIWSVFLAEADRDHRAAMKKYDKVKQTHREVTQRHQTALAALRMQAASADEAEKSKILKRITAAEGQAPPDLQPPPRPRMHADEVPLLLKLAASLKLLLAPRTTAGERARGARLLHEYLVGYKDLYGVEAMVPNHHFASHIPDEIEEFASIYEIWAFLPERLNKTLKGTNLNNRRGGQQEVTMMREYYRDLSLRSTVTHVACDKADKSVEAETTRMVANRLLHHSREGRGTAENMQDASATVQEDALLGARVLISAKATTPFILSSAHSDLIMQYYNAARREAAQEPKLYHSHDSHAPRRATFFERSARTLAYIVINGRRVIPGKVSGIVKVVLPSWDDLAGDIRCVGWSRDQTQAWLATLGKIKLEIRYWAHKQYIPFNSPGCPPLVIPVHNIRCQLARGVCEITTPKLWITTTLEKVPISIDVLAVDSDTSGHE
ncbi:hypothetical protein BN946_scf184941.g17 [Trametes cinnabarina]|uniref:Uncharacterized protein n=1 Tax=Pycnoporus cinnabarinus TaxID=5643 RepID=A0A060STV5_PYCCI|nr:hypothetical protein BN946_scf184941.g17 [Trametes cinnabarina]